MISLALLSFSFINLYILILIGKAYAIKINIEIICPIKSYKKLNVFSSYFPGTILYAISASGLPVSFFNT